MTLKGAAPTDRAHNATRIAFRLARRMSLAHRGRAALIVAMIALPISGLAAAGTVVASTQQTLPEVVKADLGRSQAQVQMFSPPDPTLRQGALAWTATTRAVDDKGNPTGTAAGAKILDPRVVLPAGTEIIPIRTTSVVAKTATGFGSMNATQGPAWSPALAGRYEVLSGRAPRNAAEVMASPAALLRLGAQEGSSVELLAPKAETVSIVGTMRDLVQPASAQQLFGADAEFDRIHGLAAETIQGTWLYLPSLRVTWSQVQQYNKQGMLVESREVMLNPPLVDSSLDSGTTGQLNLAAFGVIGLFGVFALFEVCLLAGAAFLVGTRADLRALATVASVGGDRRVLFRTVSFGGVVLGLIGGTIGVAIGVLAGWLIFALIDNGSVVQFPAFHPSPILLAGIVALAVFSGWIASLLAARSAAHVDISSTLRAARRPAAPRRRRPIIGLVLVILGAALTIAGGILALYELSLPGNHTPLIVIGAAGVAIGPCLMQVGVVLCAPLLLLAVARLLSRGSLGARIASRDAARNPARTVPVLAAVMSVMFVATAIMNVVSSEQVQLNRQYQWATPKNLATMSIRTDDGSAIVPKSLVNEVVDRAMPGAPIRYLSDVREYVGDAPPDSIWAVPLVHHSAACAASGTLDPIAAECAEPTYLTTSFSYQGHLWVGSPDDLAMILGRPVSDADRGALASGGAVALYPQYLSSAKTVQIDWWTGKQLGASAIPEGTPARSVTLPAVLDRSTPATDFGLFLSNETADSLGISHPPSFLVMQRSQPISNAEYDQLNAAWQAMGASWTSKWSPDRLRLESGPAQFSNLTLWIILAIAGLIMLGSSAVAIGLARSDGRRDEEILAAVGAPPRLRRSVAFWQVVSVAALGAIFGSAIGLLPVLALTLRYSPDVPGTVHLPFAPDGLHLGLTTLALPLVIAIGAWLTSGWRSRSLVRRDL